jgi:hypothetical protein
MHDVALLHASQVCQPGPGNQDAHTEVLADRRLHAPFGQELFVVHACGPGSAQNFLEKLGKPLPASARSEKRSMDACESAIDGRHILDRVILDNTKALALLIVKKLNDAHGAAPAKTVHTDQDSNNYLDGRPDTACDLTLNKVVSMRVKEG